MRRKLYILIACEESQSECLAFRELGHIAYSCDIQPCQRHGNADWHILGDCRPYLHGRRSGRVQSGQIFRVPRWDLIIAHPPCTYLTKVGSMHYYKHPNEWVEVNGRRIYIDGLRYSRLLDARDFFFECLSAEAPYVAVENPIPMALAQLPRPNFYACPSWFGVKYTKKTYYWVRNLPPLLPAILHPHPKCFVRCSRGKYRSRTFPELARAIAFQWSTYILDNV